MARYCTQCGQALPEAAAFCINCGAQQGAAPVAPPPQHAAPPPQYTAPPPPYAAQPVPPQPVPPAGKSSGLGKVLLILGGVFLLIVGTGIAGVAYVAYKAKNAVQQAAKREGIDLGELMAEGKKGSLRGTPCSFLSASEAGEVLGVNITRAEDEGGKCNYYAQRSPESQSKSVEDAYGKMKGAKGGEGAKEFERLTKEIVAGAVDPNAPYLTVEYNQDGKTAMTGYKIAMRAMGQNDRLEGVGEEAFVGPMASVLMFLKNGVAVQLDLRQIAGGREKGAELAKRIASRL